MKRIISIVALLVVGISAFAQYQQVKLKYKYSDLEPYIDSTTMRIHYSLHHAGYLKNLNKTVETFPDLKSRPLNQLLANIQSLPPEIQTAVRNNGGGVYNHNLYFDELTTPSKSVMPEGLRKVLSEQFGSVDAFKESMEKAAMSRFGSGWAWLLAQPNGKLLIVTTPNQDAPIMDVSFADGTPIMNIDIWEHAYYLKYQNKRADYLKNLWSIIDWNYVYENYKKATGK